MFCLCETRNKLVVEWRLSLLDVPLKQYDAARNQAMHSSETLEV